LLNVLSNQCSVSIAFDPASGGIQPPFNQFDAIWDTGATNCVITQEVIDKCGLIATGVAQVHGVHGPELSETYLVNIALPNGVVFPTVQVTKGRLVGGANMLIGMNIIAMGDFAVTNHNGLTKFSFRVPSIQHIDFNDGSGLAVVRAGAPQRPAPSGPTNRKKRGPSGAARGRKKK
jgi:hypothetical protein